MTSASMLDTGSSPSEVESLDLEEDCSLESSIAGELIDEAILGLCFDIHRSIKRGVFTCIEQSDPMMKQFELVDCDGLDVFGQVPLKKQVECICPNCQRNMAANRFAPHLEKCMGMGRNSSRLASRRLATSGRLIDGGDDDDDNYFDDDWTWNSDRKTGKKNKKDRGNSPRRAKAPRKNGEAGTPRPETPSSVHSGELPATKTGLTVAAFEPLGIEEKKALLSQTCGVISEHTGRMCTRSHRCPQHSDDQRQTVRLLLLGYAEVDPPVLRLRPDGSSLEPDDVIDVDSYEDGDGQALRDTLNRSWEEESNVSTGDDNSPAGYAEVDPPVLRLRPDGSSLEPDDVIDVDSYEDGDGQALRDTLNRSWEEESNVSTGDDNSPAAFGSVATAKKKRKKKAKHKRRPR